MQGVIREFVKKALNLDFDPQIEVPTDSGHGHYSSNLAMQTAKAKGLNPRDLAAQFAQALIKADGGKTLRQAQGKIFAKIEVAGPGFINFWLSREFLGAELKKRAEQKEVKGPDLGKKQRVIIDYSQPNIAKRMHVGHLRSTIIGDALANLHDFLGYKTVRWNYYGDWGTQFGKLIAAYKIWGSAEDVRQAPIETLLNLYVRFHAEAKDDPTLEAKGAAEFKRLEDGDSENRKLWEWFKRESLAEFYKIYARLGIEFDVEYGEAYYEKKLTKLIKELNKRGVLKKSEGALVIEFLDQGLAPALVQKSDGATLYLTRDIASLAHRLKKYKPTKILYVVSNEQALHFQQLFAAAKMVGLNKAELAHIKFGMVLGEDGKKLSTREGRAIRLEELMDKVTDLAYKTVSEKNPELPEEERRQVAEIVGLGALKYSDLKENRHSDIVFNWERMLDLRGDTAPYLQYTAVRMRSILKKSEQQQNLESRMQNLDGLREEVEWELVKKILDFEDAVVLAASQYMTSHLAKYLYELAQLANHFYEKIRILEDSDGERKQARLVLVGEVVKILEKGLGLLGIRVPDRI